MREFCLSTPVSFIRPVIRCNCASPTRHTIHNHSRVDWVGITAEETLKLGFPNCYKVDSILFVATIGRCYSWIKRLLRQEVLAKREEEVKSLLLTLTDTFYWKHNNKYVYNDRFKKNLLELNSCYLYDIEVWWEEEFFNSVLRYQEKHYRMWEVMYSLDFYVNNNGVSIQLKRQGISHLCRFRCRRNQPAVIKRKQFSL